MGKREENKLAKALTKEIEDGVKAKLKGTGWKKKHRTFFRQSGDAFLLFALHPRITINAGVADVEIVVKNEIKPVGIDPLYWDIIQLPENKEKPLSFRGWASFKTDPARLFEDTLIADRSGAAAAIEAFVSWLPANAERALQMFAERPFSDLFDGTISETARKTNPHHGSETRVCALILEDRREDALALARQLAPTQMRNHPLDGDHSKRVNFHELAILYLAGRESFDREVTATRTSARDWASMFPPK
ncbi:MAG: hypothetical protein AAFY19_09245 [Pseudomonadota bacterium]